MKKTKELVAGQDTPQGLTTTIVPKGTKGWLQCARYSDKQALVKWQGISAFSSHPFDHLEPIGWTFGGRS